MPDDISALYLGGNRLFGESSYPFTATSYGYATGQQVYNALATAEISSLRAFATHFIPYGWLICNGASLPRASYRDLYARIGTTWGSKDASSFYIPDLINRVIRGATTAGAYEEDAIQNITGKFGAVGAVAVGFAEGAFYADGSNAGQAAAQGAAAPIWMNFDASRVVRTASETRVRSARAVIAIRYA